MNISAIAKEQCYGCELCGEICPRKAITFQSDCEGFLYPQIDYALCIECGRCFRCCPANTNNIKETAHNRAVYALSIHNNELLKKSSSGGAGFSIMQYGIDNCMKVVGVTYDDNYTGCHYAVADSVTLIEKFRGTKYLQAQKSGIYRKVKDLLVSGHSVIFIGLPCEVAACRLFLEDKYDNIVFVELICHGATSPQVAVQYLERMVSHNGKISWMTIRDKKYGWTPGCLKIIFDNGKVVHHLFDSTEYGYAFRNMSRPSCYNCKYKGDCRTADITIGDYWGVSREDSCWNPDGVSAVFAHTEKGDKLIHSLTGVQLTKIDYYQGIKNNSMINVPRSIGNRVRYSSSFCKYGIFNARKENESIREKIIRILRNIKYKP